jgi:hypothetical protein
VFYEHCLLLLAENPANEVIKKNAFGILVSWRSVCEPSYQWPKLPTLFDVNDPFTDIFKVEWSKLRIMNCSKTGLSITLKQRTLNSQKG